MNMIISFVVGLVFGTIGGVTFMAIMQISGRESKREEEERERLNRQE